MPLTVAEARAMLLEFPGSVEAPHFDRFAYRAGGPIFATLGPHDGTVNLRYTPEQQAEASAAHPGAVAPVPGGWGRMGYTTVKLPAVERELFAVLVQVAWEGAAAKRLRRRRG